MWSEALTPNRSVQWPWEGHVHRLDELDEAAIRGFVERDRELWALAQREPDRAARIAIEDRVFFRRNEPRLGEPIYRSPENAKLDRQNVHCGRGTGHLGTGLYFFGTLQAAASKRIHEPGVDLRELVRGIYLVDMEHVPDERICMPTAAETQALHDFAKALICWPDARQAVERAQEELQWAEEAFEAADVDDGSDEAFYALQEAGDARRRAQRDLRDALLELDRRQNVLERRQLQPNMDIDELIEMLGEIDRTPREGHVHVPPWRRTEPEDVSLPEVKPLAPAVMEAIERYQGDVAERRFPGYHPMTYYMQERGFEAVLHASWHEFNSGDIGNLWYP